MGYRRNSAEDASINLTPMIDVVFLLVIRWYQAFSKVLLTMMAMKVDSIHAV